MKPLARLCVLIVAIVTLFGKTVLSFPFEHRIENLVRKAEQVSGKSIKDAANEVQKAFDLINDIELATGEDFETLTGAASKYPKYGVQHAVQKGGKIEHGVADYLPEGENYESIVKKAEKATGRKLKDIFQQGEELAELTDQVEEATGKKIYQVYEYYLKYNENLGDDVQKPVVRVPLRNRDAIGTVNHANNLRQEASNKVRGVADRFPDRLAAAKKKIVNYKAGVASN